MDIADSLAEFGVPMLLICATVLIGLASMALHLLFPPSKGKCPIKSALPTDSPTERESETNQNTRL